MTDHRFGWRYSTGTTGATYDSPLSDLLRFRFERHPQHQVQIKVSINFPLAEILAVPSAPTPFGAATLTCGPFECIADLIRVPAQERIEVRPRGGWLWNDAQTACNVRRTILQMLDDAHREDQAKTRKAEQAKVTKASADERLPWSVIGLLGPVDEKTARRAYRARAKAAHPDAGGTLEAMQQLNRAWDAICKAKGWT